jgi:hypothetical protein
VAEKTFTGRIKAKDTEITMLSAETPGDFIENQRRLETSPSGE